MIVDAKKSGALCTFALLAALHVALAFAATETSTQLPSSSTNPSSASATETKSVSDSTTLVVSNNNEQQLSPADENLAESVNSFALNFLKNFPKSSRKSNVVYSPLSLQSLLNVVLLGAKQGSQVETELLKTLGYASGASEARATLRKVTADLLNLSKESQQAPPAKANAEDSNNDLAFSLKNLLLVNNETCKLNDTFIAKLHAELANTVEPLIKVERFEKSDSTATKLDDRVNDWVANATSNKITKIVDASDVEAADAVLLNAAFFKASWLQTFKQSSTSSRPFYNHGEESKPKDVKFMSQLSTFAYVDFNDVLNGNSEDDLPLSTTTTPTTSPPPTTNNHTTTNSSRQLLNGIPQQVPFLNCSILSMPFSVNDGQELSMVFLLPTKRDGLDELVDSLNATNLNIAYKFLNDQQINVELPKFSFESTSPAKDILSSMGLSSVFSYSQGLSSMFASPIESKLDNIIHKAQVSVDETGAEAAAASVATIIIRNFVPVSKSRFVADHPFLFIIRHNKSNLPLFVGRVTEF